MAKFEVGDTVQVSCPGRWADGLIGEVIDAHYCERYPYRINFGNSDIWPGVESELFLIEPAAPKPKTIPARSLSGKHIGRVVTITTKSGAVVTDELSMVGHSGDGVTAILKSVSPEGSFVRGQGFDIDPDSEVIVK